MGQFEHFPIGVNGKIRRSEINAFPETEKTFKERIAQSETKIENAMKSATMVAIAKDILLHHPEIDIDNPEEVLIAPHCDDYDSAVIVGICRQIERNISKSN